MIMLKISDIKQVMKKLLYENETTFDSFLLSEAIIKMGTTFNIDGHINPDFYSAEEVEEFRQEASKKGWEYDDKLIRWYYVKSHVLSIIKGHKTPGYFSIVLYLSKENIRKFISGLSIPEGTLLPDRLMLQLKYEAGSLYAITGTAYPGFTIDKTIDREWDIMVRKFLNSHNIPYEELS